MKILTVKTKIITAALAGATLVGISGCQKLWDYLPGQGHGGTNNKIVIKNYSVNPSLVKMFPQYNEVKINTLISSDDVLAQSPSFVYGAQPDGAGLLKDPASDGYVLINTHEIHRAVSRLYLDKTFKPKKGEYIVDGIGGQWRMCSATMATREEHGFGPLFLSAGESGADSRVLAIDPFAPASDKSRTDRVIPALGRASMENAVPLPKESYPGKTVIMIGEDDANGQVIMYISNTVGNLNNGKLYFLRRKDLNTVETNITKGNKYDVEFVEIENSSTATGAEIAAQSVAKNAVQFTRVEDLDYRKGGSDNGRELYFTATGVASGLGRIKWGRVYKLELSKTNPLKGKLEIIADGDINPGNDLINPDNLCVTDNYVYIQEDGDSFYPDAKHDSYIWIYNIKNKTYKPFLTMWHRRDDPEFNAKYNPSNTLQLGSWEFGAMHDISKTIGVPNTFLVNIHPHTWRNPKFLNADGSGVSNNSEGGQTVILSGVPK